MYKKLVGEKQVNKTTEITTKKAAIYKNKKHFQTQADTAVTFCFTPQFICGILAASTA